MQEEDLEKLLDESGFPGNTTAFEELQMVLGKSQTLGFIGAGASAPMIPMWSKLLRDLLDEILKEKLLPPEEVAVLRQQVESDPLEVASFIEEAFTPIRFRAELGSRFFIHEKCTEVHQLLMRLPLRGIVTTNYDDGFSVAFVREFHRMPDIVRASDRYELLRWVRGEKFGDGQMPILHWHGVPSSPEEMIFTSDDYTKFYAKNENISFIEELWKVERLLVVGFSFNDPFLARVIESTLRSLPSGNRHFALVGYKGHTPVPPLLRRQFSKKYRLIPIFYTIKISPDQTEDHSALKELLQALIEARFSQEAEVGPVGQVIGLATESSIQVARKEFDNNLFVSGNTQLYVEPRLYEPSQSQLDAVEAEYKAVSIDDVVTSQSSFVIFSNYEYGATSLSRRLVLEYHLRSVDAFYRDANSLPNYRKKLEQDTAFAPLASGAKKVMVLDNVDLHQHERLLKEVVGLDRFSSLIILVRASKNDLSSFDDLGFGNKFKPLILSHLERSDIRTLAAQLYDTSDSDLISSVVEKVYNDLLDLCIPLTPSNVIMYLTVVHREGDFVPLNRLQIMDYYIKDLLRRPSDAFLDAFNADNKIDVVSAFVYNLYSNNEISFTESQWQAFCAAQKKNSLISFNETKLLGDLLGSRLLVASGSYFHFKYRLFFSYFLGRHVANRPAKLKQFIEQNRHLKIDGLVEVISGLSIDNTDLVTDLVVKT